MFYKHIDTLDKLKQCKQHKVHTTNLSTWTFTKNIIREKFIILIISK